MSLVMDGPRTIFVTSANRNRTEHRLQGEFKIMYRGQDGIKDPLANGYVLHQDEVSSYTSGTYETIAMTTGIPLSVYEGRFINQWIDIRSAANVHRGTARLIGIGAEDPRITLYLDRAIPDVVATDIIYIRQLMDIPVHRYISGAVSSGVTSLTITNGNSITNSYVGSYIRDLSETNVYRITAYNATTKAATISPPLVANIDNGDAVEIYSIVDNYKGFTNMGSFVTQNAMGLYKIKLDWLRVPRVPLFIYDVDKVSAKRLISDLTHVIVRFSNTNEGIRNGIISSDPVTSNAQFIVPCTDLTQDTGKFITLKDSGTCYMMINPAAEWFFGVYTPDGRPLFYDVTDESFSPEIPNPDIQIAAMFTLERCKP